MKISFTLLLLIMIGLMCGCSSSHIDAGEKKTDHKISLQNIKESIPPGVCRIIGKVIEIDSSKENTSIKDPCSKQPCWAKVRINSILGYGAGSPILSRYDTVLVKFAFTLGPTTKDLFPNLTQRLPGLQVNSTFQGDLRLYSDINMSNKDRQIKYLIYSYQKLTK